MSEMSTLARSIYRYLVRTIRRGTASVTYRDVATAVSNDKITAHPRSPKFHAALTEVTKACREHGLPAVTSIVWKSGTKQPSDGYFPIAYPRVRSFEAQLAAWKEEHARVLRDAEKFPGSL